MKIDYALNYNAFIGCKTLLYGEKNKYKTFYTANFLKYLIEKKKIESKQISILDFAPNLTYYNHIKIGGRIEDFYKESLNCNYLQFKGEIIPPRMNAKNNKELYFYICQNYKKTSKILTIYNEKPTPFLIINDLSIYLHKGNKEYLLSTINKSTTFFGNSYYGYSISSKYSKLLNIKERKQVEYLIKNMDHSILL